MIIRSSSRVPLYKQKVLNSRPVQPMEKKIIFGAEEVAQWEDVCLACAKPWVQFSSITKQNLKMVKKISGINVTQPSHSRKT
jgi:hypothetical protein